ncbi:hypothetical protein GCM10023238_34030 [Streptomyces heliomycini]
MSTANKEIEHGHREAVEEPVPSGSSWGWGRSNTACGAVFDTCGKFVSRTIVGFFAVDDISTLPDAELYDRPAVRVPAVDHAAGSAGIL